MNETIKLYFKDSLIGNLSYVKDEFIFKVDDIYDDFFVLKTIGFDKEKVFNSKNLFFIFLRFIPHKERTDIIKEAKIIAEDSVFEILKKVSKINIDKDQFWIGM